jgi:2-polyprenyl-3-methyl-5-hydroxy-6-metoxy-1,4-benzoquinol methylase
MLYTLLNRINLRRVEECRTLIRWLGPRPRERILDVGCGDGSNAEVIAQRGALVTGIEVNRERLAIANRKSVGSRIAFHLMNAEEMELEDESFDKAVSFCVIEHFRQDYRVLAHLNRVLKPKGMLVLSADSLSNPEITDAERNAHRRRYAVNTFYTIETVRKKLDEAGFQLERAKYILTTPLTLTLVRLSWRLDDLSSRLTSLKALGYLALRFVGKPLSDVSEHFAGRRDSGLTLLARARKR